MIPDLSSTRLGEELNLAGYPHLEHIIQTGFKAMPGVNRFKDVAVYTNAAMSPYEIPHNNMADVVMRIMKN